MVASFVLVVAPIQSSAYAGARSAARIARIWLCSGEKSTMHESCPACGGSTRVGTTPLRAPVEKARSRATGASNATSLGEVHRGRRRVVADDHQRIQSTASSGGVAPRSITPAHQLEIPSTAAAQAATPSAKAISSNVGG